MRASGILFPISSLPGQYGIGGFSKEAYAFADWLKSCGQKYWQILPLGPTGYGDSPYQSLSTFAGNPYFISIDELVEQGLLTFEERDSQIRDNMGKVDYGDLFTNRIPALRKAYDRFVKDKDFNEFCENNAQWLDDYAIYRAIKDKSDGKAWYDWNREYKFRDENAINEFRWNNSDDIDFYRFCEFEFDRQWKRLKEYVNSLGIKIIGDLPIYVSPDSADAWSEPELLKFDSDLKPEFIAGCPPDYFSPTGQLWGNPVYDWDYHKQTGYKWWIRRIKRCLELYDVLRLDHFRGFASYYEIPFGSETAINGEWVKGPGISIFNELKKQLGDIPVIAEDLGLLTDDVFELLDEVGYPGMKVLEFAFGSGYDNLYLPYNFDKNCVVYTGTHDNAPLVGWLENIDEGSRCHICDYIGRYNLDDKKIANEIIRLAMSSAADTCIIPMQDWLLLGNEQRINTPSTTGENWRWRMIGGSNNKKLSQRISFFTKIYAR